MSDDLQISLIELNIDNPEIIEFLRENVQPKMSAEVYKWEYFFEKNEALFVAAKRNNQVVCTQSFLPYYLKKGNEIIKTSKSENSFLSSELRGSSTFKDVYDKGLDACKEKNQQLVWGFTPAAKVWRNKLGFYVDEDCTCDFRTVINQPTFSDSKSTSARSFAGITYNTLRYFSYSIKRSLNLSSADKQLKEYAVRDSPSNYSDIEELYSKTLNAECIRLIMNETYINWRIVNNPNLKYKNQYFYKDEKLLGFNIYSINEKSKSNCAQLCEFIAVDEQTKKAMTHHLLTSLKKEDIVYMEYFGNLKNQTIQMNFNWLQKHLGGRLIQSQNFSFVVKTLNDSQVEDTSKFYFNALWTEGFDR